MATHRVYGEDGGVKHRGRFARRTGAGLVPGPQALAGHGAVGNTGDSAVGPATGSHWVGAAESLRSSRLYGTMAARSVRDRGYFHVARGRAGARSDVAATAGA